MIINRVKFHLENTFQFMVGPVIKESEGVTLLSISVHAHVWFVWQIMCYY